MPVRYGVDGVPAFLASSSEIDIVDELSNAFERATVFIANDDATGTLTIRMQARITPEGPDWFQIGDDITQEPATKKAYVSPDLFGDFRVRAVRKSTKDVAGRAWVLWDRVPGVQNKRDKGTRPS